MPGRTDDTRPAHCPGRLNNKDHRFSHRQHREKPVTYLFGELPVVMLGAGTILLLLSNGNVSKSGSAMAGAILISGAYPGINQSTEQDLNQHSHSH